MHFKTLNQIRYLQKTMKVKNQYWTNSFFFLPQKCGDLMSYFEPCPGLCRNTARAASTYRSDLQKNHAHDIPVHLAFRWAGKLHTKRAHQSNSCIGLQKQFRQKIIMLFTSLDVPTKMPHFSWKIMLGVHQLCRRKTYVMPLCEKNF